MAKRSSKSQPRSLLGVSLGNPHVGTRIICDSKQNKIGDIPHPDYCAYHFGQKLDFIDVGIGSARW